MKLVSSFNTASDLNVASREKECFAPLLSKAQLYLAIGILMRLGFSVAHTTGRGGTYDLIIPAFENHSSDPEKTVFIRAQVRTARGNSLRLIAGIRAGVNRIYLRGVKEYKYTMKDNDLIIGVDPSTIDLYFVPTRYIGRWGKSVSKGKLQVLKNNFEILLNWNEEFLADLERRL